MAEEGSSGTISTTILATTTIVLSVVGVIAAILALPEYRLIWFVVIGTALVPLAMTRLKQSFRKWPYWQRLAPLLAALVILATGSALISALQNNPIQSTGMDANASPSQAYQDQSTPIEVNLSSFNPSAVGECLSISLSGHVPAGEELVIANQSQGNPQRYFKSAKMGTDSNTWTISMTLGSKAIPKGAKSQTFTVDVALMTKWLADYLSTMQQYQGSGNSFWVSSQWPPSALKIEEFTVNRTQRIGPSSCPP
jgi:hypothetical protein